MRTRVVGLVSPDCQPDDMAVLLNKPRPAVARHTHTVTTAVARASSRRFSAGVAGEPNPDDETDNAEPDSGDQSQQLKAHRFPPAVLGS